MKRALILGAVLLAGGGAWWWTEGAAPPPAPLGQAPGAAPAEPPGIGALGRVEPLSRIRKLTPPGGMAVTRVQRLLVEEGAEVVPGQLLAEFADAAQKDAAVAQSEATLAQQRETLARIRAGGRPSEVAAQRARIAALGAQEEIARRDAARTGELARSNAGSTAIAERGRFLVAQLSAQRQQAEADLITLATPRPEDVRVAEAEVAGAEAALLRARADAELSRIRAPIAGTILRIFARAGDQVGSDGLLEMADLSRLDVVAEVYETDLPRLREGLAAEVIIPGEPRRLPATVREIGWQVRRTTQSGTDPVAATDSRTVEVRLTLPEETAALLRRRTNMQVQVAIRPTPAAMAAR